MKFSTKKASVPLLEVFENLSKKLCRFDELVDDVKLQTVLSLSLLPLSHTLSLSLSLSHTHTQTHTKKLFYFSREHLNEKCLTSLDNGFRCGYFVTPNNTKRSVLEMLEADRRISPSSGLSNTSIFLSSSYYFRFDKFLFGKDCFRSTRSSKFFTNSVDKYWQSFSLSNCYWTSWTVWAVFYLFLAECVAK